MRRSGVGSHGTLELVWTTFRCDRCRRSWETTALSAPCPYCGGPHYPLDMLDPEEQIRIRSLG